MYVCMYVCMYILWGFGYVPALAGTSLRASNLHNARTNILDLFYIDCKYGGLQWRE